MVLHHPLAHRGRVGIRHRDDLDEGVVPALGAWPRRGLGVRLVGVAVRRVVADDGLQELQLLLHAVVHASLHRRHDLQLPFQQRQRGAHGGLGAHVRDLHVRRGGEPSSLLADLLQQRQERLGRLLVGQGHDVVAHRA